MTKKKLPLLGKSLMPEVLPAPMSNAGRQSPRERVRARLHEIAARTAALAAAAALSANCDNPGTEQLSQTAHAGAGGTGPVASGTSGSGVVDPPPPGHGVAGQTAGIAGRRADSAGASGGSAGQSGGSAGHAGAAAGSGGASAGSGGVAANGGKGGASGMNPPWLSAGYGVVDPMPNPASCPDPAMFEVTLSSARWRDDHVVAVFNSPIQAPRYITDAKTSAPISVQVSMGNTLTLTTSSSWPQQVDVEVSIECMTNTGMASVHVTLRLDTSVPSNNGNVPYQVLRT